MTRLRWRHGGIALQLLLASSAEPSSPVSVADDMKDDKFLHEKMGGDAWGFNDNEKNGTARHCRHGIWDAQKKVCQCFKGWSTAHITDTVDFLEGVCEQYHCESDQVCQDVLGIPDAMCPVKNWNCYCGWKYAFMMGGHGFETPNKEGGGECMGMMYTFSLWASLSLEEYFKKAWMYFFAVAACFIWVGRKRFNCDHHRPSIVKTLRTLFGFPSNCDGSCVEAPDAFETLRDDFAWSLYILELCLWSYFFLFVVYIIVLFIWSIVLWMAVIITGLCVCCAGICMACGEGAGASCDCNCADCGGCGCGDCCFMPLHSGGPTNGIDAFYWSGTWPYDPMWGYSGYGGHASPDDCTCCGECGLQLCRPIAWMMWIFPAMPENMWGGFIGWKMGTRTSTAVEDQYTGGNSFIDFMGMAWRRSADLHGHDSWRQQVYDFLATEPSQQPSGHAHIPQAERNVVIRGQHRRVQRIGGTQVIEVDRCFSIEEDRCIPSSFEDYTSNACWICQDSGSKWDMWMSCRHLFCEKCSTEMQRRRMPCPLCRVASTTVLRGQCLPIMGDSS